MGSTSQSTQPATRANWNLKLRNNTYIIIDFVAGCTDKKCIVKPCRIPLSLCIAIYLISAVSDDKMGCFSLVATDNIAVSILEEYFFARPFGYLHNKSTFLFHKKWPVLAVVFSVCFVPIEGSRCLFSFRTIFVLFSQVEQLLCKCDFILFYF